MDETEEFEFRRRAEQEAAAPPAPPAAPAPESLMDKVYGAGEVAQSGIMNAVGQPLANVAGVIAHPLDAKAGAQTAERLGNELSTKYAPKTPAGQRYAGNVADWVDKSGLSALPPDLNVLGPVGAGARTAGQQVRGAAQTEAGALKNAASSAKLAMTPRIAPDTATWARKAQDIGIDIRPDMLTDNKFARIVGEALEKVPLSGSKAEQRQQAFNRAIMNTIGADAPQGRLTPDVFDKAFEKAGKTIGDISERTPVPLDAKFQSALAEHVANTAKETADVTKIVNSYVHDIQAAAKNGVIDGTAFRKINTQIGQQIRGSDSGDLRRALGNLQDDMQEALAGQLSGNDLAILQDARKKYAIANKLIPLVAKSPKGDISPAGLMQAVTSDKSAKRAMARGKGGDIGDLAKIGQLFLKEPGTSNTAERGLAYSVMGGGALAEPTTTAGIYGAANLYNRLGPAVSRKLVGKESQAAADASGLNRPVTP